jgi:CxxC motif-containing protein (DUF1111 family)
MKNSIRKGTKNGLAVSMVFAAAVGGSACGDAAVDDVESTIDEVRIGSPIPGLTSKQLARFSASKVVFEEVEEAADGLGPTFNERACGNCHTQGDVGGAGDQFEVRAGRLANGVFDDLVKEGGQLFQIFGIGSEIPKCKVGGEVPPHDANVVAKRRTTAIFGLGLVDATPDSTFVQLAAHEPLAIRGKVNMVHNIAAGRDTVGKFGWKSQNPTLFQFAGDAYLNEMGITNPEFPNENPPNGNPALIQGCDLVPGLEDDGEDVAFFTDFMRMLAPPSTHRLSADASEGDRVFSKLGCDGCHVRTLTSGKSDIDALSRKTYHPFSDFLLHDMGSLGDDIGNTGTAGLREMRTAPLWGLRALNQQNLLHDGRAHNLADAIAAHDGQGAAARDAFNAARESDQKKLIEFLRGL